MRQYNHIYIGGAWRAYRQCGSGREFGPHGMSKYRETKAVRGG